MIITMQSLVKVSGTVEICRDFSTYRSEYRDLLQIKTFLKQKFVSLI
jgi:hypothetical protein